jgi:hypothetical protein
VRDEIGKNSNRKTSPFDFFKSDTVYASEEVETSRFAICNKCPYLRRTTKQCTQCGCFMKLKTKLAAAECPIGKWHAITIE